MLISIDGLCSFMLWWIILVWFWQMIFNWSLHILGTMWILFLLISSVIAGLAGLLWHCHYKVGGALSHFCQDGVKVQVFYLVSIDISVEGKNFLLQLGRRSRSSDFSLGLCWYHSVWRGRCVSLLFPRWPPLHWHYSVLALLPLSGGESPIFLPSLLWCYYNAR